MIKLVNSKIRQHFTKESLLKPCICQIQGFSKDPLVKSTFEIQNVRK